MASALPASGRERSVEEAFECVLPYLPSVDRSALRSVCGQLRNLANGTCHRVSLNSPPVFHGLASSQLLKRFPRVNFLEFTFGSPLEVKAATMFILTSQSDQASQLARLTFSENRAAAQHLHQQQQMGGPNGGYGQESRFQQYGYNSGARANPQTFDFTEALLASVCSCPSIKSVSVDKTVLLDTEAAALARLPNLHELRLATNSSAQPLRRPLLQLMLSGLTTLRVLKLSYIRDTTADMALSLPRLPHLTKLVFQYAYWGESGAGERIMAALAKYQKELAELHLYESSVNDDMLRLIMGITTLRRLHIQDENAEEESCPTNKGLARITQLRRLEQLELFGEELQLDGELLGRLAQLPALRYLAMAGLDSLQVDDADSPAGAGGVAFEELDAEVEEMDLSSTMDGDEETEDSFSCLSGGGDEATSRPQLAGAGAATAQPQHGSLQALGAHGSRPHPSQMSPTGRPPVAGVGSGAPTPRSSGCRAPHNLAVAVGSRPTPNHQYPGNSNNNNQQLSGAGTVGPSGFPAPLQVLRKLHTLRLYGPSSLCVSPPPLALLLPQPQLRHLKLSACASHANLRALSAQAGLHKLIVSHTSVPQLYPPCASGHYAGAAGAAAAAAAAAAAMDAAMAPGSLHAHALPPPQQLLLPSASGASILGFHAEVLAGGLTSLKVLRIKDLPGLMDTHLVDLAAVLSRLPYLGELKLRALGMVSDAGMAALAAVTQLRRLKLYALGDGVTEAGVAHLASCLPRLQELKVKDCRRVGPTLRHTVAAFRSHAATATAAAAGVGLSHSGGGSCSGGGAPPPQLPHLVVRYGTAECDGARQREK